MLDSILFVGGDMTRYVKQNDELITAENYSSVDALVFAELSYAKFEDNEFIRENMTIKEYAAQMAYAELQAEEVNMDKVYFLNAVANSDRYSNCMLTDFAAENEESQWAALTIQLDKNNPDTAVVAMRGTDGTTLGWEEDLQLFYDPDGTRAQELSAEYLKNVDAKQILMTGHSKGGNDVMAAYMMNDAETRDRVIQINNFDGPGMNPEFIDNPEYAQAYMELEDKLYSVYPSNSIIGKLLVDNPGEMVFIDCDTSGHTEIPIFGTHDPYSFQIDANGKFVPEEQTYLSEYLNAFLDGAMEGLTNEERRQVVEVLVELGVPALIAGSEEGNPYADDPLLVMKIFHALEIWDGCSEEKKEIIKKMIVAGFDAGKEYIVDGIENKIRETKEKIREGYEAFVEKLRTFGEGLYSRIVGFGTGVAEKTAEFYQGLKNFVAKCIGKVTGAHKATGDATYFRTCISKMQETEKDIYDSARKIEQCVERIQTVQRRLDSSYMKRMLSPILNSLKETEKDYNRYGNALGDIITRYEMTEKRLANRES